MINKSYIASKIIYLDEVDSTSNYLKRLLANFEPICDGTAVMAEYQYSGRGQQDAKWISEAKKNITTSFYLKNNLSINDIFTFNKIISLGIYNFLKEKINGPVFIKWPNDFIYEDKKLGGVLIENTLGKSSIMQSIVGIGLNINQLDFKGNFNSLQPTSLKLITNIDYNINSCLKELYDKINDEYEYFLENRLSEDYLFNLNSRYKNNLYRLGLLTKFQCIKNNENFFGKILGVSSSGELIVENKETIETFAFKTIKLIV